jgi:hypothetical protein
MYGILLLQGGNGMKELKFRAWYKKDKEYFVVELIDWYNEVVAYVFEDYINME